MERYLEFKYREKEPVSVRAFLKEKGLTKPVIATIQYGPSDILKNGEDCLLNELLKPGDVLKVWIRESAGSSNIHPVKMDLNIIFEDEDLLVIKKPTGMPVHSSIAHYTDTLANGVAAYLGGEDFVFHCMNRLDRDTSGVTVICKNYLSASVMGPMIERREVERYYLAIVEGEMPEQGVVDAPIARAEESVILRKVDFENGKRAVTHFVREKVFEKEGSLWSLLRLKLEQGRTHQIRIHMKHIGHPIPGDYLYNPDYRIIGRQALHSASMEFVHPVTGERMRFEAELPEDMRF